jgi:polyisoprenoid-binding protein YceI
VSAGPISGVDRDAREPGPRAEERSPGVRGAVRARDGWPLRPATVTLVGPAGQQLGRAAVDAEGEFAIPVGAEWTGTATVIVAAPGSAPLARTVVIGEQGLDLGVLTLVRPGDSEPPRPGRWTIDPAHSTIAVTAQHLGLSKIHGRFRSFSGELLITAPVEQSRCEAQIEARSIDTGNEQRDEHLRSADFLAAEQFPLITYRSVRIERAGQARWTVHGELELAGTVRPVPLDLRYSGTRPDPWGGTRAAFTATARLNREDFRMNWNQVVELGLSLVGTHLQVELDIQAVLAA